MDQNPASMKLKLKENPTEWRNFTLISCGFLLGVTALAVWRGWIGKPAQFSACALASLAGLVAIWRPQTFRGFYRTMMTISFALGQVSGKVILGGAYLFVVTPLGLLLRIAGKDLLHMKWNRDCESYWKKARAPGRFENQF